ncbi:MAG: bacterioferritin [Rhodospirillales bacterium]|nr:bacterioferritin [uncultured Brevundimonas sp.]
MKGKKTVLTALNGLLTHELSAADQYFVHSRMYQDWGLEELYEHNKHEMEEELEHAAKIIERVLFLEGTPNVAARAKLKIGKDVPTMIKSDLAYEVFVRKELVRIITLCEKEQDFVTRQMLVGLLEDTEEDHLYWCEKQLGLIEKMGLPNYIQSKTS